MGRYHKRAVHRGSAGVWKPKQRQYRGFSPKTQDAKGTSKYSLFTVNAKHSKTVLQFWKTYRRGNATSEFRTIFLNNLCRFSRTTGIQASHDEQNNHRGRVVHNLEVLDSNVGQVTSLL